MAFEFHSAVGVRLYGPVRSKPISINSCSKSPRQESSGQVLLSFTLVRLPHQRTSRFLSPSAQDAERLNTVLLEGAKDTAKKLNFRLENRSSFTSKARRLICFI